MTVSTSGSRQAVAGIAKDDDERGGRGTDNNNPRKTATHQPWDGVKSNHKVFGP
jgi:hypothetical protein